MMIHTDLSGLGETAVTIAFVDPGGRALNTQDVLNAMGGTAAGISTLITPPVFSQLVQNGGLPMTWNPPAGWAYRTPGVISITQSQYDAVRGTSTIPANQINDSVWASECAAAVGTPSENAGFCKAGKYIGGGSANPNAAALDPSLIPSSSFTSSILGSNGGSGVPTLQAPHAGTQGSPISDPSGLLSSVTGALTQSSVGGLPLWLVLGGAAVALFMFKR